MGSDNRKPNAFVDEVLTSILVLMVQVAVVIIVGIPKFDYALTLPAFEFAAFRDVSMMIFFGFGFLMTFLEHHGLSAIGYCLVISAIVVELSLVAEYAVMPQHHTTLKIENMMNGLFCAGAVMISFGAVIGKVTPFQLVLMAVIEVWGFWVNFRVATIENPAHDVGGGLVIHTFGAYFGLAATWWVTCKDAVHHDAEKASYVSDIFSVAGTIILWVLWPSFNAAIAGTEQRQMLAACNTLLSLCSSTIAFAVWSRLLSGHRFNVVHLQNSTLAGGVAMGVAADMEMGVHGAMIGGFVAGTLSCIGYSLVQPLLLKLNIHDTCGINNLHGMPGILSGIIAIIVTAMHNSKPGEFGTKGFEGVSAAQQTYGLLISLALGIGFGTVAGVLMTLPWRKLGVFVPSEAYYSDALFWAESEPEHKNTRHRDTRIGGGLGSGQDCLAFPAALLVEPEPDQQKVDQKKVKACEPLPDQQKVDQKNVKAWDDVATAEEGTLTL